MKKEEQQKVVVKKMIEAGEITRFKDIFGIYPITRIITLLKTNHATLTTYINDVSLLRYEHIEKIATYFKVDIKELVTIIHKQYASQRPKK